MASRDIKLTCAANQLN